MKLGACDRTAPCGLQGEPDFPPAAEIPIVLRILPCLRHVTVPDSTRWPSERGNVPLATEASRAIPGVSIAETTIATCLIPRHLRARGPLEIARVERHEAVRSHASRELHSPDRLRLRPGLVNFLEYAIRLEPRHDSARAVTPPLLFGRHRA